LPATVSDAALRERLAAVERRLAEVVAGDRPASSTAVQLSPRELDVLACAALGSTNAQIAQELALKETTVKSYLAAAMSKLEATTRHAAVAKARRARLLP
jgi:DNA-binding NarL/FixJ family response regulator